LGNGAFGQVYRGINIKSNQEIVVKIEQSKNRSSSLKEEHKILKYLQGGVGIPEVYGVYSEGHYNLLVLELLGPNLEQMFQSYKHLFSLQSILMIADQILSRLEFMHSRHFIHRDVKPENFLIGRSNKKDIIHMIDFGLSKRFRNSKTAEHIPYREGRSFCGTARFASIFTHFGIEQSRRDDLESLGYCLMYFLRGNLPWQSVKGKTRKEKHDKIMEMKICYTPERLCDGFPEQFVEYFNYCRNLQFEEIPDYNFLRNLFKNVMLINDYSPSLSIFDWTSTANESYNKSSSSPEKDPEKQSN